MIADHMQAGVTCNIGWIYPTIDFPQLRKRWFLQSSLSLSLTWSTVFWRFFSLVLCWTGQKSSFNSICWAGTRNQKACVQHYYSSSAFYLQYWLLSLAFRAHTSGDKKKKRWGGNGIWHSNPKRKNILHLPQEPGLQFPCDVSLAYRAVAEKTDH